VTYQQQIAIFQTSSVWLSKEYDFALDDLNLSVLLSDSGDLILSATKLLNVRSPIWTYQFLQHFSIRSPRSDPINYWVA